jgi:hypothetical protein
MSLNRTESGSYRPNRPSVRQAKIKHKIRKTYLIVGKNRITIYCQTMSYRPIKRVKMMREIQDRTVGVYRTANLRNTF